MSEDLADRPGSLWTAAPRAGSLRIGDAERDEAVTVLSEHFVAGRLTQDEFEQRSNQATQARYADELSPLFADLPEPATVQRAPQGWQPGLRPQGVRPVPPPFFFLAPLLLVGLVVAAVLLSAPGILWLLFFLFLFARPHHHRGRGHWHHHRQAYTSALHQRRPKPLGW